MDKTALPLPHKPPTGPPLALGARRGGGKSGLRLRLAAKLLYPGAAALLICARLLGAPFGSAADLAALAAIAAAGLPHGAFDLSVARAHLPGRSLLAVTAAYLAAAGAAFLLWSAWPLGVIIAFLLASLWHFSGDFRALGPLASGAAAALVAVLPAHFFPQETAALFVPLLGGDAAEARQLVSALGALAWFALPAALAAALTARRAPGTALALAALIAAGAALPPLVSFALYFVLRHSTRHYGWLRGLARSGAASGAGRGHARRQWAGLATLCTAAAAAAGAALWLHTGGTGPAAPGAEALSRLSPALFALLIALTFPHMALLALAGRR